MIESIIGITNGTGEAKCVADHCENVVIGYRGEVDGIFVDHPLASLEEAPDVPIVNTCLAVRNAILSEQLQAGLFEQWGVSPGAGKSSFFSLFNGQDFSDWLEVGYSPWFMTGNVGPKLGFIHGAGLRVTGLEEALPNLAKIQQTLRDVGYRGEVLLYVNDMFEITEVRFGHFYAHWGIYTELCKSNPMEMLSYLFGGAKECTLYDSICVANLVTLCPFPSLSLHTQSIHAPKNAEKHLWRVAHGTAEKVLVTVHGDTVHEARRRIRRTVENMLQSSPELQYRIDYGFSLDFVLAKDEYRKLCERNANDSRSNSNGINRDGKSGAGNGGADTGARMVQSSVHPSTGNEPDSPSVATAADGDRSNGANERDPSSGT